jgi:creatinine deaminase
MKCSETDLRIYAYALDEAKKSLHEGGIPIGAALARNGSLLGIGHNRRIQENDTTAHAEIDCLRNAGRIGDYSDTTLYTTLFPCYLCSGAIMLFKIKRLVIGQSQTFDGEGSFDLLHDHGVELINLQDAESIRLMNVFIAHNPKIWMEDIGHS